MRKKFKLGSLKPGVVKTAKKIIDESRAKKQDKARVKKMGGGMMGRRMGYQSGMSVKGDDKRDIRKTESMIGASRSSKREKGRTNKPISRSKNPGLLAMSKTAKGKEAVKKMKFNPDRIVAKKGGKA